MSSSRRPLLSIRLLPRVTRIATLAAAALLGLAASPLPGFAQEPAPGLAPRADQRVVLITGSTSGLGREVAHALAERGDHVIVHGRNVERGMEVVNAINDGGSGTARFYRADFADFAEVRRLADEILRDYDRLDVLLNNAGIGLFREPERIMSRDGHELHWQVNYLSHYLLTDLLLPLLRSSAPSRIVNVSSRQSGRPAAEIDFENLNLDTGYGFLPAYGRSKRAQVMHVMELALQLEGTGVTANALHPGDAMDTPFILSGGGTPQSSVVDGARRVLQLVDDEGLGSGNFFRDGRPVTHPSAQVHDVGARRRLMRVSALATGIGRD